jgi:hypothetical protein
MARKKDEWVTVAEATGILTKNSGHAISDAYVRRLGNTGKIETKPLDGRTKLYNKADIENYIVAQRGKKEEQTAS